jgi:hypothetical protein
LKLRQFRIALASFLLAKRAFHEIQSPYYEITQDRIVTLRERVGDEQFTALLATIEPQAEQIIDQELGETN